MFRFSRSVCSGLIVAAGLLSTACAARTQDASVSPALSVDQLRDAFSSGGYQLLQQSAQTPNGVVVFDANGDPILVPGAGGNPQQAPGVG